SRFHGNDRLDSASTGREGWHCVTPVPYGWTDKGSKQLEHMGFTLAPTLPRATIRGIILGYL
ncbi:MAG: hypothetical protein Q7R39_03720, partial [Dehalococcoidia bacterium]|nr:hypothetical protein [Dehalococcoidia bacterium]